MEASREEFSHVLKQICTKILQVALASPPSASSERVRPYNFTIAEATDTLNSITLPENASSLSASFEHLLTKIVPSIMRSTSPTFYGFVTGGCTPAAMLADHLVTVLDQNLMVHLPRDNVATIIERCALGMLCDLVNLPRDEFLAGSTITTGATASNVLGLALGREYLLRHPITGTSVSDVGYLKAAFAVGATEGVKVVACMPHSSIEKASSILGIGRESVIHLPFSREKPWDFNLKALDELLRTNDEDPEPKSRYIVVAQHGEVNTGKFSSNLKHIREMCDTYGAWLHVDAAFGLFARCLRNMDDEIVAGGNMKISWSDMYAKTEGLELADSITGDGHKLLNVPYDCGLFFSRHAELMPKVFANVGAAYLPSTTDGIVSPSNINIENSRRFRALPIYATLTTYGFKTYQRMVANLVIHARQISTMISSPPFDAHLELLSGPVEETYNIVLFKAKDQLLNGILAEKLNTTGRMWVSGTTWVDGDPAVRIAVGNWRVDDECVTVVKECLLKCAVWNWDDKSYLVI